MLSLDKTDEGITVCGRFARRIPRSNWFFSFLLAEISLEYDLYEDITILIAIKCKILMSRDNNKSVSRNR